MTINQLADPRFSIGGNHPPLAERLAETLAPFRIHADKLIEVAKTSIIVDDTSAGKVTNLIVMMLAVGKELEAAREADVRPHVEAQRIINAAYSAVTRPLVQVHGTPKGRDGLYGMLNAHKAKREAEAEAERAKAREEQRRREAEAEEARRVAEEAAEAGKATVGHAVAFLQAQEAAEAAARRAEAIRPEPIRAQLGQVGSRRDIVFTITDLRKLLGFLIKSPMRGGVEQACRTIMGAYLRQLGVEAVARGVDVPGVEARVETNAQVRR